MKKYLILKPQNNNMNVTLKNIWSCYLLVKKELYYWNT